MPVDFNNGIFSTVTPHETLSTGSWWLVDIDRCDTGEKIIFATSTIRRI